MLKFYCSARETHRFRCQSPTGAPGASQLAHRWRADDLFAANSFVNSWSSVRFLPMMSVDLLNARA